MTLTKDWSLTHFLYYVSWIAFSLVVLSSIATLFINFRLSEKAILVMPKFDPLVEIHDVYIPFSELESEEGTFLSPMKIYSYVGIGTRTGDFSQFNSKLTLLRFVKFTCLGGVLFFLSLLLKSVVNKNPFDSKNPKRLYAIGSFVILFSLVDTLLSQTIANSLNEIGFNSDIYFSGTINIDPFIFLGLVIVVFGYIFQEGTRISEEQKLTV